MQARLSAAFEGALLSSAADGAAAASAAGGTAAAALAASLSAFSAFSASWTSLVAAPSSGCCSRSLASSGLKPRSGSASRSPRTASRRASSDMRGLWPLTACASHRVTTGDEVWPAGGSAERNRGARLQPLRSTTLHDLCPTAAMHRTAPGRRPIEAQGCPSLSSAAERSPASKTLYCPVSTYARISSADSSFGAALTTLADSALSPSSFHHSGLATSAHAFDLSKSKARAVATAQYSEPTGSRSLAARYRCAASTSCPELESALPRLWYARGSSGFRAMASRKPPAPRTCRPSARRTGPAPPRPRDPAAAAPHHPPPSSAASSASCETLRAAPKPQGSPGNFLPQRYVVGSFSSRHMSQMGCFSRPSPMSDGSRKQPMQARLSATFEGAPPSSAAGGAAAAALAASPSAFSAFRASRTSLVAAPKSGCCCHSLASSGLKPRSGSATRSPHTASRRASSDIRGLWPLTRSPPVRVAAPLAHDSIASKFRRQVLTDETSCVK
eukprot:scaffold19146_cov53-Phaeocystis_antarctica.AAC.3